MTYLGESVDDLSMTSTTTADGIEYQLKLQSKRGTATLARLQLLTFTKPDKIDVIRDVLNRLAFENIYSCVMSMES